VTLAGLVGGTGLSDAALASLQLVAAPGTHQLDCFVEAREAALERPHLIVP
jgi:hypothetical protein